MKNIFVLFFLIVSCNYSAPITEKKNTKNPLSVFSYDKKTTSVSWTAYKLIEKVGVSGFIDSVVVLNTISSPSPVTVFKNASFYIYPQTINSMNLIRDQKIVANFFGPMKNHGEIKGKIKKLNGDSSIVVLSFNGIEKDVLASVSSKGTNVVLNCDINVLDWGAESSLKKLNQACSLEHKGGGNKSVLWPDIKIKVSTKLKKTSK